MKNITLPTGGFARAPAWLQPVRLVLMAACAMCATVAQAQVGMRQIPVGTLPVTLVYPTDATAQPQTFGAFTLNVAMNDAPKEQRHRLIVMSHGTGGSPVPDHALAAALARAGFVAETDGVEERFIFLIADIGRDGCAAVVDRLLLVIVDRDPRPGVDLDVAALASETGKFGLDEILFRNGVIDRPQRMHHQSVANLQRHACQLVLEGGDPDRNFFAHRRRGQHHLGPFGVEIFAVNWLHAFMGIGINVAHNLHDFAQMGEQFAFRLAIYSTHRAV